MSNDESQRRFRNKVTDTPRNNRRWTDEEIGIAADESLTTTEAAELIGRSIGSVISMRHRLRRGWESQEPNTPLTDDEIDVIRSTPNATAEQIAQELGRPYHMVTRARRSLIEQEDLSFGRGPYDKDPFMVGHRLLIARTCTRCGIVRGGAEFNRDGGKLQGRCRYCRAELRDDPPDKYARHLADVEQRVRELADVVGVPYRSRDNYEYTERDLEVLADNNLTTCQMAAKLGRSYDAVGMARRNRGILREKDERPEPGGIWIIKRPPTRRPITESSDSV